MNVKKRAYRVPVCAPGGVLSDRQSAFHAPVSQPKLMLRMQPGANVDADARVGVAVGMGVDVGVGVGVVTGVFVGVGVAVGVVDAEPPSSASSRAISLSMSELRDAIRPFWVSAWFRSVVICSCCVLDWASSWLTLALTFPDVVTVVAVRVGIGAPLSSRATVGVRVGVFVGAPLSSRATVGVRVGVAVFETPVGGVDSP